MSKFQNDSIFWIEVDKIKPNPYQPRKEFSSEKLNYLAESIRQYGVLQPLVVTRHEIQKEDGGLLSEYELIAGERRLRASKIAGLSQVPVIIRTTEESNGVKLELAIIENLQREDLNPIDRATAFQRLVDEFNFKHNEIAKKVGKSREYVTNSLRLLTLPEEIIRAISVGQISEGHARPILMLRDRPEEQNTLFKEIVYKKLTVRDAEAIARKIAYDKVRKREYAHDPELMDLEGQLAESLGTRVHIERKEVGGKLLIDFFSNDDLKKIIELLHSNQKKSSGDMLDNYINNNNIITDVPQKDNSEIKPLDDSFSEIEDQVETFNEPEPEPESEHELESNPEFDNDVVKIIPTGFVGGENNDPNSDTLNNNFEQNIENNRIVDSEMEVEIEPIRINSEEETETEDTSNDDDLYSIKDFGI